MVLDGGAITILAGPYDHSPLWRTFSPNKRLGLHHHPGYQRVDAPLYMIWLALRRQACCTVARHPTPILRRTLGGVGGPKVPHDGPERPRA